MRKKIRSLTMYLVLILGPLLLILLVFELAASFLGINEQYRLTHPSMLVREDPIYLFRVRENMRIKAPRHLNFSRVGKPDTSVKLTSFNVETNSRGLREATEISLVKSKNETRVICFGDSVTFGWGVDNVKSWPAQLQLAIDQNSRLSSYHFVNCGQPGFSSAQAAVFYEGELRTLNADMVFISFGHNDHSVAIKGYSSARSKFEINTQGIGKLKVKLRTLNFYLLLERFLVKLKGRVKPISPEALERDLSLQGDIDDYEQNIRKLVSNIRKSGAKAVILTQPRNEVSPITNAYNKQLRKVSHSLKIPLIDLAEEFDTEMNLRNPDKNVWATLPNELFWDNIHLTDQGNTIYARIVKEWLINENAKKLKPEKAHSR